MEIFLTQQLIIKMKIHLWLPYLQLLLVLCQTAQYCSSNVICGNSTVFAYCTPQNYCQCNSGYVLNCTNLASVVNTGSSTLTIQANSTSYYILDSSTQASLYYIITLTDNTQPKFINIYNTELYIDDGPNAPINYPSGIGISSGSSVQIQVQVKLGDMPGTTISEQLILAITNTGSLNGIVSINYSFSAQRSTNILLIIGYVAGGVLLIATLFFMAMIYRQRRAETNRNGRPQQNNESKICDISHFNVLMPLSSISRTDKKEGRTCSVCLIEFEFTSIIRTTICGHMFHSHCIDEWCLKNLICPLCRTELTPTNIIQQRAQQSKRQNNSSWIMNSMNQDEQYEEQHKEKKEPRIQQPQEELEQQAQYYPLENQNTHLNQTHRPTIGNNEL